MTPAQNALLERLRDRLAREPVIREVSMFGGRSIMVNEKMILSALEDGGLLVRVDAHQHQELLERPGATEAEMGPGRDMGPGWIQVSAEAITREDALSGWIAVAMQHNRAVTGGAP